MIVVHHLNNSRSQRVLWLLEELGVPYEIQYYQRDKNMRAPDSLKRVHPLGKSPVLVDDGVVIAESGAIVEYILDRYGSGRLRPVAGTPEFLKYRYWMYFSEGSAMPPLLLRLIFNRLLETPKPFFIQPLVKSIVGKVEKAFISPNLNANLDFIESTLASSSWFAGPQFSGADIMMSFPLEAAKSRVDLSTRPQILKFLEAIHSRPAYQRALERGGPYDYSH